MPYLKRKIATTTVVTHTIEHEGDLLKLEVRCCLPCLWSLSVCDLVAKEEGREGGCGSSALRTSVTLIPHTHPTLNTPIYTRKQRTQQVQPLNMKTTFNIGGAPTVSYIGKKAFEDRMTWNAQGELVLVKTNAEDGTEITAVRALSEDGRLLVMVRLGGWNGVACCCFMVVMVVVVSSVFWVHPPTTHDGINDRSSA